MVNEFDIDTLKGSDFDTVIVAATDMQGRLFGRRLSLDTFLEIATYGVHVSSCALGWDIAQAIGLEVEYTGFHTGWHDFRLVPDLNSFKPIPWLEKTAIVMSDIAEKQTGTLLPIAPRTILKRQIQSLNKLGYEPNIGTELEFFLYNCSYDQARASKYQNMIPTTLTRSQDLINRQTNALEPFFRELGRVLDLAGIKVLFREAEWGHGQWEVNIAYQKALDMADHHTLFKLATKDIASNHNLAATFMARPTGDDVGSSCHIHISLQNSDGTWVFYDENSSYYSISSLMRYSLGGLLAHTPELMIWYAPMINSYRRTASQQFASYGRTWGFDNRTVTCRIIGHAKNSLRIEFRVPGADVNPYLGIASVLGSIKDGLEEKLDPGSPTEGNAYWLENVELFPNNLAEATDKFETSNFAKTNFGDDVVRHYAAHARFEWTQFMNTVTDWEKERYFESI